MLYLCAIINLKLLVMGKFCDIQTEYINAVKSKDIERAKRLHQEITNIKSNVPVKTTPYGNYTCVVKHKCYLIRLFKIHSSSP